jgi:hypothetical protein
MTVQEMADRAAQVCDGVVASVESYWTGEPAEIVSEIRFINVSYLKGAPSSAGTEMTLIVPGGTVGSRTMRLAGAPEFQPGQRWVLFLLPAYRTFPTVGVWEGAFRIQNDESGTARVFDAAGRAVVGLDSNGFVRSFEANSSEAARHCKEAHQVRLLETRAQKANSLAMSLDDFRSILAPILAASRNHSLDGPSGVPIPTRYTPVPMQRTETGKRLP